LGCEISFLFLILNKPCGTYPSEIAGHGSLSDNIPDQVINTSVTKSLLKRVKTLKTK